MKKIYSRIRSTGLGILDVLTRKKGIEIPFNGLKLRLPGRYFRYFKPGYEQDNFIFLKEKIKPGDACLDIGAHIGIYSIYMAKMQARVFSFEPTPSSFVVLNKVIAMNHCGELVTISPKAVAGNKGMTSFYLNHSVGRGRDSTQVAEANSLVNVYFGETINKEAIEVETVSVDHFAAENQLEVRFIKIDVEGAELDVLKGASKTFLADRPCGILSVHNFAFPDKEQTLSAIWEIFVQFNMLLFQGKEELDRARFLSMSHQDIFDLQFLPRPGNPLEFTGII